MDPVLGLFVAGLLLGLVTEGRRPVVVVKYERDWTWISGDTKEISGILRQKLPEFSFSKRRLAWYATSHVEVKRIEEALLGTAEVSVEEGKVLAFREREREQQERPGHRGQVVGLPGSGQMEMAIEDLLRSPAIKFGTGAPFAFTSVTAAKKVYLGWDEPAVLVNGFAPERNRGDATPTAKQIAFRYADRYGFGLQGHVPKLRIGRTRMVADQNPSSPSVGKTKRMEQIQWVFPIAYVPNPFTNPDTGKTLPESERWRFPPDEYNHSEYVTRWDEKKLADEGFQVDFATARRQAEEQSQIDRTEKILREIRRLDPVTASRLAAGLGGTMLTGWLAVPEIGPVELSEMVRLAVEQHEKDDPIPGRRVRDNNLLERELEKAKGPSSYGRASSFELRASS